MPQIVSLKKLLTTNYQLLTTKTIVLVTGVFDLLHSEHQKFLQKAKQQGDILLVGIESDKRVKKLKGKGRPVWKLPKRLQEMTKLSFVDYVFPLPEKFDKKEDHEKLVSKIRPNILAISASTPNQEEKKRLVEKYGGQLRVVLPHNPKISTTKLLKRIPLDSLPRIC